MRLARLAGIAAMSVVSSLTGVARADDTKIALRISGCEAANIKADRLFELVRTELFPHQLMAGDIGPVAPELFADVRLCSGTANAVLISIQRAGLNIAQRILDLSDVVGDLRARTLAVALAEMVTSLPAEQKNSNAISSELRDKIPNASNTPIAPTTRANAQRGVTLGPSADDNSSDAKRARAARTLQLGAGVAARHFFDPRTWLLGPWMSISAHRFSGEALFLTSNSQVTAGSVVLYNLDAAAAYEVIAWGTLPKFTARLKGELGKTWAKGNPTNPSSAQGQSKSSTQSAALLEVLVDYPMSRRFGIEARLSGGRAWGFTATADSVPTATSNGLFVGASLGLSFDLCDI